MKKAISTIIVLVLISIFSFQVESQDFNEQNYARRIINSNHNDRIKLVEKYQNDSKIFLISFALAKLSGGESIIKKYFNTNVADITLNYESNGFHVSLAEDEEIRDDLDMTDWHLSAHRKYKKDKRTSKSTYLNCHSEVKYVESRGWMFHPVNGGESFKVSLFQDDMLYDGVDEKGWYLKL